MKNEFPKRFCFGRGREETEDCSFCIYLNDCRTGGRKIEKENGKIRRELMLEIIHEVSNYTPAAVDMLEQLLEEKITDGIKLRRTGCTKDRVRYVLSKKINKINIPGVRLFAGKQMR